MRPRPLLALGTFLGCVAVVVFLVSRPAAPVVLGADIEVRLEPKREWRRTIEGSTGARLRVASTEFRPTVELVTGGEHRGPIDVAFADEVELPPAPVEIVVRSADGGGGSFWLSVAPPEASDRFVWLLEKLESRAGPPERVQTIASTVLLTAARAGHIDATERAAAVVDAAGGDSLAPRVEAALVFASLTDATRVRAAVERLARGDAEAFALPLAIVAGREALGRGDVAVARAELERAAELARAGGREAVEALALVFLALAYRGEDEERYEALQKRALAAIEGKEGFFEDVVAFHVAIQMRRYAPPSRWDEVRALLERCLDSPPRSAWLEARAALLACDVAVHEHAWKEAEEYLDRAIPQLQILAPFERTAAEEDVAHLEYRVGRGDDARARLERLLAEDHLDVRLRIEASITLSWFHENLGDEPGWRAALDAATSALELCEVEQAGTPRHAAALVNRGRVHRKLGDTVAARGDFEAARAIAESIGRADLRAMALHGTAEVARKEGRSAEAERLVRQVIDAYAGNLENELEAWTLLANLQLDSGDHEGARETLSTASDLLSRADALGRWPAAEIRSRFWAWSCVAQDVAAASVGRASSPAGRAAALEQGLRASEEWRARALSVRLSERGVPGASALRIQDVQSALPDGAAILAYGEGAHVLRAFVLTNASVDLVELGTRDVVEKQLSAFADLLDPSKGGSALEIWACGHELYRSAVAPALALAPSTTRIVVVPSPLFASLSVGVLCTEPPPLRPREKPTFADLPYAADRFTLTYAPSVTVLLGLSASRERTALAPALLVGDAIYEPESGNTAPEIGGVPPLLDLPDSRVELDAVSRALGGAAVGEAPRIVSGSRATPEAVRALCKQPFALIHFAVHGWVDEDRPDRTGLVLSRDRSGNPLLTLDDIRALGPLDAPLVVLSACNTASGRSLRGEGPLSMANAFLDAGARGVVATFWATRDASARRVMEGLYAELVAGRCPAEALSVACTSAPARRSGRVTLQREDPHIWGAFAFFGPAW